MRKTKATSENVTFSNITAPAGFSINPDGTVNVPANALPGDYIFTYTLCPIGSTTGCVYDIIAHFTIYNTVRAIADVFNFDTQGNFLGSNHDDPTSTNILTNDGYAADCGFSAPNSFVGVELGINIDNFNISPTSLGVNLNISNTGVVVASGNLIAGTYHFTYDFCDFNYPTTLCTSSYGWVNVIGNARMASNSDEKFDNSKIIISPNPSSGIFSIEFGSIITETEIEVFNILGQNVLKTNFKNTSNALINLSSFANGTYLLKISDGIYTTNKLLIKK